MCRQEMPGARYYSCPLGRSEEADCEHSARNELFTKGNSCKRKRLFTTIKHLLASGSTSSMEPASGKSPFRLPEQNASEIELEDTENHL